MPEHREHELCRLSVMKNKFIKLFKCTIRNTITTPKI